MKELSIKEKAERYDEAIKVAQRFYNNSAAITKKRLEDIFPELKDSEDEKIRKEMIFYFTEEIPQCSIQEHSDKMREFISWLKRQEVERTKLELKAGNSYFCYKSRWERADSETFKKGLIYKCNKDGVLDNFVIKNPEQHFIEIKDERISWLEKQGEKGTKGNMREIPFSEQKPVEQKFVNNKFKMTKSKKQIILLTQQEGNNEIAFATDSLIHAKNMLGLGLAYINELINEDDKESVIPNGNFLSNYFPLEPWSDEQTKRNLINFLKSLGATEIPQASLNRYLAYLEKQGEQNSIDDLTQQEAMDIAVAKCFDWIKDQDEYELVEQNPAWSEEDDDNLSWLVEMLLGFDGNDIECYKDKKFIDKCKEVCKWLKAIKDRTFPQPKQEWTEDDKDKLNRIYSILGQATDTHAFSTTCRLIGDRECIELQDFLKSLRPQKHEDLPKWRRLPLNNVSYAPDYWCVMDVITSTVNGNSTSVPALVKGDYYVPLFEMEKFISKEA